MSKHKSHKAKHAKKKMKKALGKAKKHGPVAAALAIIGAEVIATLKHAHLERHISTLVERSIDRLFQENAPSEAAA